MAKKGKGFRGNPREQESFQRPIKFRNYKYFFLIVCEDQKTERIYFEQFSSKIPENTFFLRSVGTGLDPLGVVEQSIIERLKLKQEARKEVDETWAVFDKDDADENDTKIRRFNEAFSKAKDEQIKIAYSNEVFELWLLLHLKTVSPETLLPRKEVYQCLEDEIKRRPGFTTFQYKHGDSSVIDAIIKLGNENSAIQRAESLLNAQKGKMPIKANPSTRVHLLVKSIREKIEFYSWIPD